MLTTSTDFMTSTVPLNSMKTCAATVYLLDSVTSGQLVSVLVCLVSLTEGDPLRGAEIWLLSERGGRGRGLIGL
jgi:hypothetical protein